MRLVIDNFLDRFSDLRNHCDGVSFGDLVNPLDGVSYPGISTDIPPEVVDEVVSKLSGAVGRPVSDITIFMRMTTAGTDAPHQAHTDALMGDVALLVYLNRESECDGGTSFVSHTETGMDSNPQTIEEVSVWERDTNEYFQWDVIEEVEMHPNRAVIFDSRLMHRAEPPGGFGDSSTTGRLVLTCFARAA